MESKLKCPFCQTELDYDEYGWDYSCPNHKCRATKGVLCGTKSLWQALIQAKQDLEIARKALAIAKDAIDKGEAALIGCQEADNKYISDITAEDGLELMSEAYKKITALEQRGEK